MLRKVGYVGLPEHRGKGGFDHASIHNESGILYVAHTANDSVDLIDTRNDRFLRSIPGFPGVAGVLVSNEKGLVFTSNRGEKTVGVFAHGAENKVEKVNVGGYPNGLAFDSGRGHLLAANVAKPEDPSPVTVSLVDPGKRLLLADIEVPGRTRWTVYDRKTDSFYVNISKPSQIVSVASDDPDGIASRYEIPATGPHGLDLDQEARLLFCACDQGGLFTIDIENGRVSKAASLGGTPDVIFYNPSLEHLYVAIGDPGLVEVFDTDNMRLVETVKTEMGAHTIAYNPESNKVYAFLPETHRALVLRDDG